MSDIIRRAIKEIAGSKQPRPFAFTAEVAEVEGEVCTLFPSDGGPPIYEVRLSPVLDGGSLGIRAYPKPGSQALAVWLDEQVACVLEASEYDQILIAMPNGSVNIEEDRITIQADQVIIEGGTYTVDLDGSGVGISSATDSLAQVLSALVQQLQVMAPIAAAPGSPCVPNPADVAAFSLISTRLQNLLK